MLIHPNGSPLVKPTIALTRDQMRALNDFDALMTRWHLQFALQCVDCAREGRDPSMTGVAASRAGYFTAECACRKFEYRGADAAAPARVHS